jgi:hypothetical protein
MRRKLSERALSATIQSAHQSIDGEGHDLSRLNVDLVSAASPILIRSVGFKPPSPC